MTWVSYAQNYEDVVLARVLADVAQGSYIDVGAQDSRVDSVTCAFYERGWRGINIEPVEHWHQRLLAGRPGDRNLCLAAGDHAGMLRLFEVADSGLSTVRADLAARHRAAGLQVQEHDVEVRTLDSICADAGLGEVHFLKIDAEGAEEEVLRGFSFRAPRPWIVVVEATEPNSRVPACAAWEPTLLGHDYRLAYDDGINRFYLACEHADLAERFGPPTVLDDFVRREQVDIAAMLESRLEQTDALARGRGEAIDILHAHVGMVESALASANASAIANAIAAQDHLDGLLRERDARITDLQAAVSGGRAALQSAEAHIAALDAELSAAASLARRQQLEVATLRLAHLQLSVLVPDLEAELRGAASAQAAASALALRQAELVDGLQRELSFLQGSRSWRITAPLRALRLWVLAAMEAGAESARQLARNRVLRRAAALALRPVPGIAAGVKRRLYGTPAPLPDDAPPLALTEDAERILNLAPILPASSSAGD